MAVAGVPVVVAQGKAVRVGIAKIAIGFALVGRVLIPKVLAKDIHGLLDGICAMFVAEGALGLQGSQKGAMLGFGDGTEEEAGLEFGSSLGFKIQLGLRLLRFALAEQINEIVSQGDAGIFILHMHGEQSGKLGRVMLASMGLVFRQLLSEAISEGRANVALHCFELLIKMFGT